MAEATALRNNAVPFPIYGAPFTMVFPILDADGDLVTGATGLDSEISKNADTPADCTNEATEIGSSGQYYLSFTGTEMTADIAAGVTKTSSSGAKTTPWVLYPRKLAPLRAGTLQAGASGTITLDSGASAFDDYYNGCLCVAVLDGATESRIITDYVGSTKVASVTPNWNTTPDSDDTFTLYLIEGYGGENFPVDVRSWNGTPVATPDTAGYVKATIKDGTGTGEPDTLSGAVLLRPTGLDAIVPAEPAGPPAFGTSIAGMIAWVFTLGRNKVTQSTTQQLVRNDADNATLGTSPVSDVAGTSTRGKYV